LVDKDIVINEIQSSVGKNDKPAVMRILGSLLTRGNEAAGFVASIGAILSL